MNDLNYTSGERHRDGTSTTGEVINNPLANATLMSAISDLKEESRKSDLEISEKVNALLDLIKDLDITGGLSPEIAKKIADLEKDSHTHANKAVLDSVTQLMLDTISDIHPHINNKTVHVTDAEKAEWTSRVTSAQLLSAISNFASKIHSHAITDVVGLKAELDNLKLNVKGDPGLDGKSPVLAVERVDSVPSTMDAKVIMDNTNPLNPKLTFEIPKGKDGKGFEIGQRGPAADRLDPGYNDKPDGWIYLAIDTGKFYARNHDNGLDDKPATDPAGWEEFSLSGEDGWSPVLAVHTVSPIKKVLQVIEWVGGLGAKPNYPSPMYLYSNGFTTSEVAATNIYPYKLPYNGLDKTTVGEALDAVQGRELDVKKADKSDTYTKAEVDDKDAVNKADYIAKDKAQQLSIDANSAAILTKLGKDEKAVDSDKLDGLDGSDYQTRDEKAVADGYAPLDSDVEVPHENIDELVYKSSGTLNDTNIVIDNKDGTVNINSTDVAFYKNPNHSGKLYKGTVPPKSNLSPKDGSTSYIKARWTGSTLEYFMDLNQKDINSSNVLRIGTVLRSGIRLYITQWSGLSNGKADRLNDRLAGTTKYEKELEGLIVSLTPGRELQMTAGTIYGESKKFDLPIYTSTAHEAYDTYTYDAGGKWVSTPFNTVVPVGAYNARTGVPVQAPVDKYSMGFIYRYIGLDRSYATVVLDELTFDTVADARKHSIQMSLPKFTKDQHMYMGRIIAKGDKSDVHIDRVTSISYDVAPVSDHGSLSGVLGNGQIHLSSLELNHMNDAYVHSQEPHAPADAYSKADADIITAKINKSITDTLAEAKKYTNDEDDKKVDKILPLAVDKEILLETSAGMERSGMVADTDTKELNLGTYKLRNARPATHKDDVVTLPASLAGNGGKVMKVNAAGTALIMADAGGKPITNLTSASDILPLSASMGKKLNEEKLAITDVVDGLTSTDPLKALSANQGRLLMLNNTDIFSLVTSLVPQTPVKAPEGTKAIRVTASYGSYATVTVDGTDYPLLEGETRFIKAKSGDIISTNSPVSWGIANSTLSAATMLYDYIDDIAKKIKSQAQIEDSLTSTSKTKALSANQGKVLNENKAKVNGDKTKLFATNFLQVFDDTGSRITMLEGKLYYYNSATSTYSPLGLNGDGTIKANPDGSLQAKKFNTPTKTVKIFEDPFASPTYARGMIQLGWDREYNKVKVGLMGNGFITCTKLTEASDKRLKKNIRTYEPKESKIRTVEFEWRSKYDPKGKHIGYIAQEVEEFYPELVDNGDTYDENGKPVKGKKSVHYTGVHTIKIANLERALEEEKIKNKALLNRIEAIEKKLNVDYGKNDK